MKSFLKILFSLVCIALIWMCIGPPLCKRTVINSKENARLNEFGEKTVDDTILALKKDTIK